MLDTLFEVCFWRAGHRGEVERLVLVAEFFQEFGESESGIKVEVLGTMILREVGGT